MIRNRPGGYGEIARLFHWAVAALIVVTMPIGLAMNRVGAGDLQNAHEAFSKAMTTTHIVLQFAIYALVGTHVAAALHHHFVRRDGVLRRMWPGRAPLAG